MDLQVAAVDDVVVGDHQLGELDVLVLNGLDGPVERRHDEVQPIQGTLLEPRELLAVFVSCLHLDQPNFPVTYSSVRESSGLVNILSVGPISTSSPLNMKAVVSATRPACCMLWVTTAIVTLSLS